MAILFTNNAASTLASGITNAQTTLTVQAGAGAKFPNPSAPDVFYVTIDDNTNVEVCQCTGRSTDVLTIVRGQDGTSGTAFSSGAKVELRIPAIVLKEYHQNSVPNQWTEQAADPAGNPGAGTAFVYCRGIVGRGLLGMKSDSWPFSLQPGLFENPVFMVIPSATTTIGVWGGIVTSVGTVSHVAPDTTFGLRINQITGTTAGNTAGTGDSVTRFFRGSSLIQPCGWFYNSRVYFSDASYGSGSTGARFFVGLTSGTMASSVGADDPGNHHAGFSFSTNAGDTTWRFSLRDGSTRNNINTTMTFTAQHAYDFHIYCPPTGGTVYWRVEDITASTSQSGSSATNVPGATTLMRCGLQICTLTTTGRNVQYKFIYCEHS